MGKPSSGTSSRGAIEKSDIKLGACVMGRVSGFPWWPALLTKSPRDNAFQDKYGRYWVSFFNESNGAYLRPTEMRPFDDYHIDFCLEYNRNVPKYKKYANAVNEAIELTKKHLNDENERKEKELFNKIQAEEARKRTAKRQRQPDLASSPKTTKRKRLPTPRYHGLNRSEPSTATRGETRAPSSEPNHSSIQPRKGTKSPPSSARKQHSGTTRPSRSLGKKKGSADAVIEDEVKPVPLTRNTRASTTKSLRRSGKEPSEGMHIENAEKTPKKQVRTSPRLASAEILTPKHSKTISKRRRGLNIAQQTTRSLTKESSKGAPPRAASRMYTRRQARDDAMVAAAQDPRSVGASSSADIQAAPGRNVRRKKRSYLKNGVYTICRSESEDTESEREDAIQTALQLNLEGAVNQIIENELNEDLDERKKIKNNDFLVRELVHREEVMAMLTNRLKNLEEQVMMMKETQDERKKFDVGEDVTAAGLKASTEAFISSIESFSRARDYNGRKVETSLGFLWPKGEHAPLPGHDGALLDTVIKSLAFGSCKRHQAKLLQKAKKRVNDEDGRAENPSESGNGDGESGCTKGQEKVKEEMGSRHSSGSNIKHVSNDKDVDMEDGKSNANSVDNDEQAERNGGEDRCQVVMSQSTDRVANECSRNVSPVGSVGGPARRGAVRKFAEALKTRGSRDTKQL